MDATTTTIQPLTEKDLALDVRELTLGTLTTNALQLRDHVAATLERYTPENYSEENVDQAKADRAILNKAAKELNDRRIQLERDWNAPLQEFKSIIGDTVKMISEGSAKIDAVVKGVESNAKAEKRAAIEELWERKDITLLPLSKLWDNKWLNKTKRLPAVEKEIGEKLLKIEAELDTLAAVDTEDGEVLRAYYLDCLDLQRTLAYSATLKANRQRLQEEQARRQAEAEAQATREAYVAPTAEPAPTTYEAPEAVIPEVLERTMVVRGTREQLIDLAEYMKASGIWFRKA
ncbi:MAG: DUF1351 domain-containing protein [Porphyromonadaceae bacterium]|nr:DUF1351 domain-containing protein [Porphyromonadaceae bacterium]